MNLVPWRWIVAALLTTGLLFVYAMRVNLSVAIIPIAAQFELKPVPKYLALAAFFIGYIFGQIPGGLLASRYGGKHVFGTGVLATALLSLVLPLAACGNLKGTGDKRDFRLAAFTLVRVLMGFCEAVTYPSAYAIMKEWAPAPEKSAMVRFVHNNSRAADDRARRY